MKQIFLGIFVVVTGCAAPVSESPTVQPSPTKAVVLPPPKTVVLPPYEYSVAIDSAVAEDDVGVILEAMNTWKAAIPVRFDVSVGTCDGADICLAYGPQNFTETPILYVSGPNAGQPSGTFEVNYTGPLGECDWTRFGWGGRIQIDVTLQAAGPGIFQNVIEHELGHAMGLVHHDGANVMSSAVTQSVPLSLDDMVQWMTVHEKGTGNTVGGAI